MKAGQAFLRLKKRNGCVRIVKHNLKKLPGLSVNIVADRLIRSFV